MNPRGVTLVELLAAISIVVVITALSVPAIQNRLGGAKLEASQGQIEAAVIATRAEAVRTGKSLVLSARMGRDKEMELVVSPLERHKLQEEERSPRRTGSVWCVLPGGMSIGTQPKVGTAAEQEPLPVKSTRVETGEEPVAEPDVQIAVFCPDGSAVAPADVYLDNGSSCWVLTVNSWVGGASFTPYTPKQDSSSTETPDAASEDTP